MLELRGKFNTAKVFTDNIENEAISQIIELCNQKFTKDITIRIMPDTHAGAGCTIGTTMTIKDKIVPNLVGVDIGCGMLAIKLKNTHIEFGKLDKVIRKFVPSGFDVRSEEHKFARNVVLDTLKCKKYVNINRAALSIGTLGGGNHFIEVDKDDEGYLYLVVHSGSRNLGKQVAEHYQNLAIKNLTSIGALKQELVAKLKAEGRERDIEKALEQVTMPAIKKDLAYVSGQDFSDYIHDMKITQDFAIWNREAIADVIMREMKLKELDKFTTVHNYINTDEMVLRKGAISAHKGELVLIPINMRDGAIIALGKGNADWNNSAPHGAGRLMSRSKAKETIPMQDFIKSMQGVWSTSVSTSTIDESPMAYKPMEEIINNIQDTVDVMKIIKPLYNFKAN